MPLYLFEVSWFRDWLGNSLTFVLGLGAATGIPLGLMFQGWIKFTENIKIGLFTGAAMGIALGLMMKPIFGIYDSWMFLLPLVAMLVSRGVTSALSNNTSRVYHGGYFLLTLGMIGLTEFSLLQASLYHENKLPIGMIEQLSFIAIYLLSLVFSYLQPFHLVSYLSHYRDAKKAADPFIIFRDTVINWGPWIESLNLPLPHLTDWMVRLLKVNRKQGITEVLSIANKYQSQLHAVEESVLKIITEDLKQMNTLEKIARTNEVLEYIPEDIDCLSKELMAVLGSVSNLAYSIQDYSYAETTAEKLKVLNQVQGKVTGFGNAVTLLKSETAADLKLLAANWSQLVKARETSFSQYTSDVNASVR